MSACSGDREPAAPPRIEVKTARAVQQDVPILREWVGQTYGAVDIEIRMLRAKSDVDRYEPLAAAGAASERDLEIALAEHEARKSEVDAAQAAVDLARIELGYATVRAPITGLIGISTARVGDFVGGRGTIGTARRRDRSR
jgi:multidrug resistance efflux pump